MRTIRWQVVLLGFGFLLIVVGGIYFIFFRAGRTPDQVAVTFSESDAVFSEAVVGQPAFINPLLVTSQADRDLAALVFSGLTTIDEFGQPIPDLAESWEVSHDGLTYIFHLRGGVMWHDGQPFTARDVDFTMRLLRDPRFSGAEDLGAFWRTVETYADDDTTVRFVLTQPLAAFPEYAGIGILPAHILEGVDPSALTSLPFNRAPIGTGPLRFESISQEQGATIVRLVPFGSYYLPQRRVGFAAMEMRFYSDHRAAFAALGSDALAMGGLTPDELDAVLASPGINLYTAPLPIYAAVIFNQQSPDRLPFFQEEDVRIALAMAVDRQTLVRGTMGRLALSAETTVLPGNWAYAPDARMPAYNPDAAAQLLDAAGWVTAEDGVRRQGEMQLAFTLLVVDRGEAAQIGQAVVQAWQQIGVGAQLRVVDMETFHTEVLQSTAAQRTYDAALLEFSQAGLADPDPYPFWSQAQIDGGQNYSGFYDREISEMLEIARRDPNGVRRADLYRTFQRRFDETAAAILLYYPTYHYAVSCQVAGVQISALRSPTDRFHTLASWRIVAGAALESLCNIP